MAKGAKKQKKNSTPTTKTWKGEEIIKSASEKQEDASPGENMNKGERVYKYSDGGTCRVVYP